MHTFLTYIQALFIYVMYVCIYMNILSRRLAVRVWGCNTDLKEAESKTDLLQVIKE